MRKKEGNSNSGFGVADGFDFGFNASADDNDEIAVIAPPKIVQEPKREAEPKPTAETTEVRKQVKSKPKAETVEVDPTRSYSKYYKPKPKKGSKGGTLGRGAVDEKDRKVQFSLTCTPAQKELFMEASKKECRRLPDFICYAVEEYIRNHNL